MFWAMAVVVRSAGATLAESGKTCEENEAKSHIPKACEAIAMKMREADHLSYAI